VQLIPVKIDRPGDTKLVRGIPGIVGGFAPAAQATRSGSRPPVTACCCRSWVTVPV
jgi:hypothetical protein